MLGSLGPETEDVQSMDEQETLDEQLRWMMMNQIEIPLSHTSATGSTGNLAPQFSRDICSP